MSVSPFSRCNFLTPCLILSLLVSLIPAPGVAQATARHSAPRTALHNIPTRALPAWFVPAAAQEQSAWLPVTPLKDVVHAPTVAPVAQGGGSGLPYRISDGSHTGSCPYYEGAIWFDVSFSVNRAEEESVILSGSPDGEDVFDLQDGFTLTVNGESRTHTGAKGYALETSPTCSRQALIRCGCRQWVRSQMTRVSFSRPSGWVRRRWRYWRTTVVTATNARFRVAMTPTTRKVGRWTPRRGAILARCVT